MINKLIGPINNIFSFLNGNDPISKGWAIALLIVSAALLLAGFVLFFCLRGKDNKKRSLLFRGFWFAILLFFAVAVVRYTAGRTGELEQGSMSRSEEAVNSIMHALQSFTLDENYTDYIIKGAIGIEKTIGNKAVTTAYKVFASVLNVLCAITSQIALGALILKLFPRAKLLKLFFTCRPVCYFSELNPESIALAKSIRESDGEKRKSLLVFCNTDQEDEGIASECVEKARRLGALMTKVNLGDLKIKSGKGKTIFLTGKDEDNLEILSGFAEDSRAERFKDGDAIYVFADDKYGTLAEKAVRDKINEKLNNKPKKRSTEDRDTEKKITLFSVNRYRSIVYNLLESKPLFTALNEGGKELRIAIFGSGKLGTEMFLAAYWCGQMLDKELKITVVSVEKEEHFKSRIDHINSEIFRTCDPDPDKELLKINQEGVSAKSYCSFEYVKDNVYLDGLDKLLAPSKTENKTPGHINGKLVDFDYFVVALGSDKKNMEVAEHIGRIITVKSTADRKSGVKVPIACAIWNDELSSVMGMADKSEKDKFEIIPFGSMGSSFAIDKVLLEEIQLRASYAKDKYEKKTAEKKAKLSKFETDPYSYWANVARAIHTRYKAEYLKLNYIGLAADNTGKAASGGNDTAKDDRVSRYILMCDFLGKIANIMNDIGNEKNYVGGSDLSALGFKDMADKDVRKKLGECIGEIEKKTWSVPALAPDRELFRDDNGITIIDYMKNKLEACAKALTAFAVGNEITAADAVGIINAPEIPECFHRLAWLEHRRWCAFMRTEGFTCPSEGEEEAYVKALNDDNEPVKQYESPKYPNEGNHKSIALKLHPCIVECDEKGIRKNLFLQIADRKELDRLDEVSIRFKTKEKYKIKNLHTYDFKKYDYPEYE